MSAKSFDRLDYIYKLCIIIALLITLVILARDIVIPLAFGGLISVVMLPLVKRIERKTGSIWAIVIVLFGTIIISVFLGWLLVNQIINLANDLPNIETKAENFVQQTQETIDSRLGIKTEEQNRMFQDFLKSVSTYVGSVLLSTSNTLSTLIQVPIYIFLFLLYREKFRLFFISLLPKDSEDLNWKKEIEDVIQGYISGLSLVTLIIAALNTIGLLFLGIDHAIFFGVLSGVLTVIPYVGIFIGAAFPVVMALITKDSIWYAIGVVIVFTIVQFLEGNFITPRITGSKVSINALAAIVALLIGGKILGIAGMILAVPAIGVLKIILSYSSHLKPFVILLGDDNGQKEQRDPTDDTPQIQHLKKDIKEKEPQADTSKVS